MGIMDKLQSLLASDKIDINMRFEFLSEGFTGTMSKFHRARDRTSDKIVGLKICDKEKTEAFEARFKNLKKPSEGEIASSLQSPRIVETYEYGMTTKGQNYIVMEYLPGPGLHIMIKQRDPRLEGKQLQLIRHMAEAIKAVHEADYIHRDVCPRNFICSPGVQSLKLIDFGLTLPDKPVFRQPGNRTGTPTYMAPEIVRRYTTDQRVDIFAFGVAAYELLTLELPWPHAEATGQGALAHDTQDPVPILERRPKLNEMLADAVTRCMDPRPKERPESMGDFLRRIRIVRREDA